MEAGAADAHHPPETRAHYAEQARLMRENNEQFNQILESPPMLSLANVRQKLNHYMDNFKLLLIWLMISDIYIVLLPFLHTS
jgi:hypothetical protein